MIDTSDAARDWLAVWMGTSHASADDFYAYTAGIDEFDEQTPICLDFGTTFIDVDWWGSFRTLGLRVLPIEELVREVDTSSLATDAAIVEAAKAMGVSEGNALYYLLRCQFHPEQPGRTYNGLHFIGNFLDPYKPYKAPRKRAPKAG